jgi:hypothetical protein
VAVTANRRSAGSAAQVAGEGTGSPAARADTAPATTFGRDSAGLIVGSAGLAGTAGLVPGRTAGDSARRPTDSVRGAAALLRAPALSVIAPAAADIYVDGVRAGQGAVRRNDLRPGPHQVRAIVPALPGCPSADTTVVVQLAPGARQQLQLDPVACGFLQLDVEPAAARYTVTPKGGGLAREGSLPLASPLYLPADDYVLTIDAAQCTTFSSTVPVLARATRSERVRLICN